MKKQRNNHARTKRKIAQKLLNAYKRMKRNRADKFAKLNRVRIPPIVGDAHEHARRIEPRYLFNLYYFPTTLRRTGDNQRQARKVWRQCPQARPKRNRK